MQPYDGKARPTLQEFYSQMVPVLKGKFPILQEQILSCHGMYEVETRENLEVKHPKYKSYHYTWNIKRGHNITNEVGEMEESGLTGCFGLDKYNNADDRLIAVCK